MISIKNNPKAVLIFYKELRKDKDSGVWDKRTVAEKLLAMRAAYYHAIDALHL